MSEAPWPKAATPGKSARPIRLFWARGLLLGIAAALGAAGCGRDSGGAKPSVVRVFAPWSMEKRVRRIFEKYQETHPNMTFRLETGTPGSLVQRMKAGERPDVYVSMGPAGVKVLTGMGIVRDGTAREILSQRMILICSEAMKDHVRSLKDLARPEVRKVGMGRPALSAGTYSRAALKKLGILESVEAKAQHSPLRSYLRGEVDAAIVLGECCYDEDLLLGQVVPRRGLRIVGPLPESLCPAFPVVAVALEGPAPPEAAADFIEFLTAPPAQSILQRRGPEACPICDGETCTPPPR